MSSMVKVSYIHPVDLGLNNSVIHVNYWWRWEGHMAKIAPKHQKFTVYMWACRSLCKEECVTLTGLVPYNCTLDLGLPFYASSFCARLFSGMHLPFSNEQKNFKEGSTTV